MNVGIAIPMNRLTLTLATALAALALASCGSSATSSPSESWTPADSKDVHWSYSGAEGPDNWGNLSPAYSACSQGKLQSPIDITAPVKASSGIPVVDYSGTRATVIDTGHTVQLVPEPASSLTLDEVSYELEQTHYHVPSEDTLNGKSYPAEFHFVHESADGKAAVIAVFVNEGAKNSAWEPFLKNVGLGTGETDLKFVKIDWSSLLPTLQPNIQFAGSLTTPACTDGLKWVVPTTPITMRAGQIGEQDAVYSDNIRPIQATNDRVRSDNPR